MGKKLLEFSVFEGNQKFGAAAKEGNGSQQISIGKVRNFLHNIHFMLARMT